MPPAPVDFGKFRARTRAVGLRRTLTRRSPAHAGAQTGPIAGAAFMVCEENETRKLRGIPTSLRAHSVLRFRRACGHLHRRPTDARARTKVRCIARRDAPVHLASIVHSARERRSALARAWCDSALPLATLWARRCIRRG